MMAGTGKAAQQLLDEVRGLAALEAFDVSGYARRLAEELAAAPAETVAALEARDARLRATLAALDAFATQIMRIRLDHALASDAALGRPFRVYLATTIASYDGDLELLRERVRDTAARVDPRGASTTAAAVVEAAAAVLAVRSALWTAVLDLARDLAAAAIPAATHAARDRNLDDAVRLRWLAVRRDLELVVVRPLRLAEATFAERLKALPVVDEVPEEAPELSRGELIEPY